jgi:glycosyltransferase involved in cell wall biosynthesis
MTKITAIIPTLNEEIHMEAAIKSVSFADEIIVIDSFSTDKTLALAEKNNVKIIKRQFDDFSSQKNFAIDQAKHDWIYILDADERVTLKVQKEILEAVKNPKDFKYAGLVHEKIVTQGKLGFFRHKIDHFSYRNFDHYICKMNHYGAIRAKELHDKGNKVNIYHVMIKPAARFFIHFIIRLGFLDGFTGFLVAKTQAYGVLTRYIKLWLLNSKLE